MPNEVELKAVLPDPATVRMRLLSVGGMLRYQGVMSDRRYDRDGELAARFEVLRLRTFHHAGGRAAAVLGWKGPMRRSPEGYKEREEIELAVGDGGRAPAAFLAALGFGEVHAIDRWVEVVELAGAIVRLESYPRMDDLIEVEGDPAAIERAVAVTGLPRSEFTADSLAEFVRRYEARTGDTAVLATSGGSLHPPAWASP
jgi:adenylate cyclase class IV